MARSDQTPSDPMRTGQRGATPPPTGTAPTTQGGSSGITGTVQDAASRTADKVQQTAAPVLDQATEKGAQVVDQAKRQVSSRLDMGVDFAAESLTGVAQALRQTGQHLRQEGAQPMFGQYADTGAEQIERFTGYLRRRNANEIVEDVELYARRNPTTFAATAFGLGLLAARFFRSTGRPRQTRAMAPYGTGGANSAGMTTTNIPRPTPTPAPQARPTPTPPPSQPPSYAGAGAGLSGAPASRTVPGSPDWRPSSAPSTGAGSTPRDAERHTPIPGTMPRPAGSQPGMGGTSPGTGGAPGTGGTSPGPDRPGQSGQPRI